ncbi:MAG: hypothetical protein AB7F98_00745 [Novosphingobium sp.]
MSRKYKFIVFSKPVEGREEEYNDWYQNQHLREVCETPGFVAAQRYKLSHDLAGDGSAHPYCALYDIEADHWSEPFQALTGSAGGGNMFLSESLDLSTIQANIYEVFGDEVRQIK